MNRPLDRERIPEYKLTISVKDNPENPRIARKVRLEGMERSGGEWEAGLGYGDMQAAWPGYYMHRPWSEQVVDSNPHSACQWVCGFGQFLSASIFCVF